MTDQEIRELLADKIMQWSKCMLIALEWNPFEDLQHLQQAINALPECIEIHRSQRNFPGGRLSCSCEIYAWVNAVDRGKGDPHAGRIRITFVLESGDDPARVAVVAMCRAIQTRPALFEEAKAVEVK
jgi:hypothetical protein